LRYLGGRWDVDAAGRDILRWGARIRLGPDAEPDHGLLWLSLSVTLAVRL